MPGLWGQGWTRRPRAGRGDDQCGSTLATTRKLTPVATTIAMRAPWTAVMASGGGCRSVHPIRRPRRRLVVDGPTVGSGDCVKDHEIGAVGFDRTPEALDEQRGERLRLDHVR